MDARGGTTGPAAAAAAYLHAAEATAALLGDPAVARSWDAPSALAEFTVRGLAGHLALNVLVVPQVLDRHVADAGPVALLDHYTRSKWVDTGPHDEVNVVIRRNGENAAAGGASDLAARTAVAVRQLREALPAEPADRTVHLPWAGWSLSLADFLVSRMLEIAVHADDLAVSVGVATPPLPAAVLDPVLALLTQLAARRHGPTAVLRALSRSERAPASIAAI